MRIHLDFETRSEVDIRKVGGWVYCNHPTTEVLCLAFAVDDGEVQILTKEEIEHGVLPFETEGVTFVAHNVSFEYMIWHNILVKRFNFPSLPIGYPIIQSEQWECTAAKAAVMGLPRSLDNASKALELGFKKDMIGKNMMLKMCKPRKATKNDSSKWHESEEDFKILHKYCKQDVEVERAIDKTLPDLIESEKMLFNLDKKINYRGIMVDMEAVDAALSLVDQYTRQAEGEVSRLTEGFLDGLSRRQKVLTWIKGEGINLPDFTKETVNEALNGVLPVKIRRVLELRQQLGKTSVAKFKAFKECTDIDGIMYETLLFYGCHTGRWSGQRAQLHNLPRITMHDAASANEIMKCGDLVLFQGMFPNVLETLSQTLRGCLVPRPNKEFIGGDQNAIEVRVLFWLAGEMVGLNQYELDQDIYVNMAKKIFGVDDIDKMKRFVGKQTVLGCGFGMGLNGDKFIATCRKHGVTVPREVAMRAVQTYRNTYRAVVAYWKSIEQAIVLAIRNEGRTVNFGKLKMFVKDDFLHIELPSGRCLHYHKPRLEGHAITHMSWVSTRNCYERIRSWGGVFTENVVQAISRDTVAHGMFQLEGEGYDCVLTVHDEILSEVDIGTKAVEQFEYLMSRKPVWLAGCPIKVKGWKGVRFK